MTGKTAEYEIAPARWPGDIELARALLKNYGEYLASSSSRAAGVCIPGYEAELRGLPGKYVEEKADLLLARVKGEGAGCVAIARRVLTDGTDAAEMKRLWVDPRFRGHGLGRGLVNGAIDWARAHECSAVVLDTVNEAMPEAAELYRSLGFEEITRFNENPVPGVRFYKLMLR
jgi:ribosomal protein S18 acetylase RimI-like enzyme